VDGAAGEAPAASAASAEVAPSAAAPSGSETAMVVSPPGTSDGGANVFKQSDSGKSVTLPVGGSFVVELRANAGTGYAWAVVAGDPNVVTHKGPTPAEASKVPGGATTQVFSFVGKGAGKTRVELAYRRSWEEGKPPAKTFKVDVTVK
jgi:inhibitor of cysteine peptidase